MRFHDTSYSGFLLCLIVFHEVVSAQSIVPRQVEIQPKFAHAIRSGDLNTMKHVLEAQPSQLEARDERGWTPLMLAAFYADVECVRMLLERGAKVNATNKFGATALHYATADLEKTRLLLKAGANANAASSLGNTPLMLAARNGMSSPVVQLLLGNRADVHARNLYGVTALMIAASTDDVETVQLLLDRGADASLAPYGRPVDADGNPLVPVFGGGLHALTWASITGNVEIAKLLIDAGANVNAQTMAGSPLTSAAQWNRLDVARLLTDRGADVNAVSPPDTWSPLMWAAGNENGETDVLELLIARGANVNAEHGQLWGPLMSSPHSPLMVAKRRGETALVDALQKAGAKDQGDPWAKQAPTPPQRNISPESVDTRMMLASITAAVPLLETTAVESAQEFAAHGQKCISCHNQLQPLMAVSLAKQKGVPHNRQALSQMLKMENDVMTDAQGAVWAEPTFAPDPAPFPGYLLWGVASESVKANFSIDAAVHFVAIYQADDGSWAQPFPRPPITDSEISATALAVRVLTLYPLPGRKGEMEERVDRARKWLQNTEPRNMQDFAYKLLGLYWAGERVDALKPLAEQLVDQQRADGGWAQLPKLESDAYATGQALYALHEAGGFKLADEAYRNGLTYLMRTQLDDGSWFVRRRAYPFQRTMDAKFPHGRDAWISTAATCWAVMAISVGLDMHEVQEALSDRGQLTSAKTVTATSKLPPPSTMAVNYEQHILPILETSCLDCHSSGDPFGQYAMDNRESLIKGGFSGPPVVVPGNSAESLLVQHVAGLIEDVEMPPIARRDDYDPLSDEQIGLLRAWIDQGLPGLNE